MNDRTALYRHFDTGGGLLYIGISLCAFTRTRQHGMVAPWFHDVARIEIEWFPTRAMAESAEWQAIRREQPLHNQTFKRSAPAPADVIVALDADLQPIPNGAGPARREASKRAMAAIRRARVLERM